MVSILALPQLLLALSHAKVKTMGDFTTLSLDLGSTLGYCVGKNGVIVESAEVTLSSGAGKTHPGHRWLRFQKWLAQFSHVNEIVFEDVPFVTSAKQMLVYGALRSQMEIFSLTHNIRMASLTPGQIKKDFTGHGNSKKDVMCDVAIRLGWKHGVPGTMNNHNEADAIALYWAISVRRGVEPSFYAEEKFVVDLN